MNKTFWVIERNGPSYLAVSARHEFVWTGAIDDAIQFTNKYCASAMMGALQKVIDKDYFFEHLPYPAEHMFL